MSKRNEDEEEGDECNDVGFEVSEYCRRQINCVLALNGCVYD
jgi:hypothetical protein